MSRWQLPAVAWLTAGVGLINLLSAVTPPLFARLTLLESPGPSIKPAPEMILCGIMLEIF